MNISKNSANDPLQAVWYSLFGQSSSPADTNSHSPSGNSSPLFMKQNSMSSNSSIGSPIGRSASETMFGLSQQQHNNGNNHHSPPGFATPNGQFHQYNQNRHSNLSRGGSTGDLQEALNSLLSNPQSLSNLFGNQQHQHLNNGNSGPMSPQSFQFHQQNNPFQQNNQYDEPMNRGSNPFSDPQQINGGGIVSNAILDLLMQSMKNDQQQQQNQFHHSPLIDGFMKERQSWSSGMSTPPSPIGNPTRQSLNNGNGAHHNNGHQILPLRSGSNGSSEMSGSSPRSPNYSPFSRQHSSGNNKNVLESGNGNVSPTPTPWNNSVLGSPPHSILGFGVSNNGSGYHNRNIWAPSVSPGNGNNNNHHGLNGGSSSHHQQNKSHHHHNNLMGHKRKVNEPMSDSEFAGSSPSSTTSSSHLSPGGNMSCGSTGSSCGGNSNGPLSNYYNDTYYKKKKKN